MKFTKKEIKGLIKAWIFISVAFAILFSGGIELFNNLDLTIATLFILSGLTVGIAFLSHELAHKSVAQKYNYSAEFKAFDKMLWLSLIMSFLGFIIAAPGAVIIKTNKISKEKNGKISLAGPLLNIIIAIIFFAMNLTIVSNSLLLNQFMSLGLKINSLLAIFNLIPAQPFDGKAVFEWNKFVYSIMMIISVCLFISSIILTSSV